MNICYFKIILKMHNSIAMKSEMYSKFHFKYSIKFYGHSCIYKNNIYVNFLILNKNKKLKKEFIL